MPCRLDDLLVLVPIIRCELARHLRDYRLLVLVVGGPVLLTIASLAYLGDFEERRARWSRLSLEAERSANLEKMVVPRPYSLLGFLRATPREQWDEAAVLQAHLVDVPQAPPEERSWTVATEPFDWSIVILTFYSLMAVALSYDAVAGEKASGTLRVVASRPIGRLSLIVSKICAGWLVVAGSLVLGVLAALALAVGGGLAVSWFEGGVVALALVEILSFLLFSVLLGVAASVSTTRPQAALQRALGAWVLLALAVPGLVAVLGSRLHPLPSEMDFRSNVQLHESDFMWRLGVSSRPLTEIVRTPGISAEEKRRRIATLEAEMWSEQEVALAEMERGYADLRRDYLLQSSVQEKWVDRWSVLSPHALLSASLDRITLAGWSGRSEFLRQVERFEPVFTSFVLEQRKLRRDEARENGPSAKDVDDEGREYELRALSRLDYSEVAVPAEAFPRFEWREPSVAGLVARAVPDLLWLFLFVTLALSFVLWRFARYDCR